MPEQGPGDTDSLQIAINNTERAIVLGGAQFPNIYAAQARNYFFAGNIDMSIQYNNRCITADPRDMCAVLNDAVLMLICDDYELADARFRQFLSSSDAPQIDWRDLIEFADVAFDMGYKNAVFIQCLYRGVLPGFTVPPALTESLVEWFGADAARKPLQHLYANRPRFKKLMQST